MCVFNFKVFVTVTAAALVSDWYGTRLGDLKNKQPTHTDKGLLGSESPIHNMGFGSRLGESPNTWKHFGPELTQEQYSVLL